MELSGYARGVLYTGEYSRTDASEINSTYGEAALRIRAFTGSRGKIFSELRFRNAFEYKEWINQVNLREAYVDLSLGRFNIRVGQAILAWGRADGINPTNNLTPEDYFVRSPEPDDMHMGNFLIRGQWSILPQLRFESVWVPRYKYSVYRFDLFKMPGSVRFSESPMPEAVWENGSLAAKLDFLFTGFDGSLSWFNGFDPMPGIQPGELSPVLAEELQLEMYARAFRQQTLGLDFSFGMGSFGVRGEAAYRIPGADYRDEVFAPEKDLRYVLQIDRTAGDFSLMAMYVGHCVFNFTSMPGAAGIPDLTDMILDPAQLQDPVALASLDGMITQQVAAFNRVLFDQTEEFSHTLGLRPALGLFHEVFKAEITGTFNINTHEWGIIPGLTWHVSDNLKLRAGGQYFEGPAGSRYDLIAPVFNGAYFEVRYSF